MIGIETLEQAGSESPYTKQPGWEPFPGYRLLAPLGSGGFGEVWKCEAPGGLLKAIKFVRGGFNALDVGEAPAQEELRAIQLVKGIRHPFLLSMERVEEVDGQLVIVLELADKNLQDLLNEYRRAGLPGVPRDELLGYLREAAEALDLMNIQHGLQHLDIKPHNLFLVYNHVKVGDFGLVNSLGAGPGQAPHVQLGAITPLYASPEVFQGTISPHSDQYSLAIVYQELLTGTLPIQGKNARQLMMLHIQGQPDLTPLPPGDRPVVARALAKDPGQRFPCSADFVRALAAAAAPAAVPPSDATPSADAEPAAAAPSTRRFCLADTGSPAPSTGRSGPRRVVPKSAPNSDSLQAAGNRLQQQLVDQIERDALPEAAETVVALLRLRPGDPDLLEVQACLRESLAGPAPVRPLRPLNCLVGHLGYVNAVAFAPDGRCVLSGSGGQVGPSGVIDRPDRSIRIWDVATGREVRRLDGHNSLVTSAVWSPIRSQIVSGSRGGTICLWDSLTGSDLRCFQRAKTAIQCVAFAPDGSRLLSGGDDRNVRLWDVDTGRALVRFAGHTGAVTGVAFLPDGRRALSASLDQTVRLWQAADGKELLCLRGHTQAVHSVAVSPDGLFAASAGGDSVLRLWDLKGARETHDTSRGDGGRADVEHVRAADLVRRHVVNGDRPRRKGAREIRSFAAHRGVVHSVAFALDGRRLLSGGADNTVRLWEVATGREVARAEGHTAPVKSVGFAPDGRTVVSGGLDRTVRLWQLP